MTKASPPILLVAGLLLLPAGTRASGVPPRDWSLMPRAAHYEWPRGEPDVEPPPRPSRPPERRRIVHSVVAGETLLRVAARYGVSPREIIRGNGLSDRHLRAHQKLRIWARRWPEPRVEETYVTQPGDSWDSVARSHRVQVRELLAWNADRRGSLSPGLTLRIWVEPPGELSVYRRPGPPMPRVVVPEGGRSIALPIAGRLENAVRLVDTALFDLRWPHQSWASSHTARVVLGSVARFRHDTGWRGRLMLASVSRRRGGHFPPHVSHRSGRDIDVLLPLLPGIPWTTEPNEWQVDWHASWALAMSFLASGEVTMVLLDRRLHPFLIQAARDLGATPEEIAMLVEGPARDGEARGVPIRHRADHYRHFHIRVRCGPDEPRCESLPWEELVPRVLPIPRPAVDTSSHRYLHREGG